MVNWIRGTPRSILALEEDSEHNPETPDFLLAIFREFSIISLCSVISRQCFAVHLFNTYGDAALEGWGIRCLRIVAGIMFTYVDLPSELQGPQQHRKSRGSRSSGLTPPHFPVHQPEKDPAAADSNRAQPAAQLATCGN